MKPASPQQTGGRKRRPAALLVFLGLYATGLVAAIVLDLPGGVETGRSFLAFARVWGSCSPTSASPESAGFP